MKCIDTSFGLQFSLCSICYCYAYCKHLLSTELARLLGGGWNSFRYSYEIFPYLIQSPLQVKLRKPSWTEYWQGWRLGGTNTSSIAWGLLKLIIELVG